MTEKKRYLVFDTDAPDLTDGLFLNKTTKKHVKAVSLVQACNTSLSDTSRAQYARQAGLFREDPEASIPDLYDSYTAPAALAGVLFAGCPRLIDAEGKIIPDKEALFDCLDEGVVNRGFLDFQLLRNGTRRQQLI